MLERLKKTQSMVEFIDTLAMYYDLQNNTPSKFIKDILTSRIKTAVDIQDKYVLDAASNSVTLQDYLLTFGYYYDEKNNFLNPVHRNKLISSIGNLVTVTRAKKLN